MPKQKKRTGLVVPIKSYHGYRARGGKRTLNSYTIGALPIINRILERMQLRELLGKHLPREDQRTKISTPIALLLLLRNMLMSRQPIYGISEWAERQVPHLLDLPSVESLQHLNDDRVGHSLDKLFDAPHAALLLDVVRKVIQEFGLSLEELHNDSTTISFFGEYEAADEEGRRRGGKTLAITKGHSKDHRPDLKQLLYTLTVTDDGGVPIYFTTDSGNTLDNQTHRQTWDLLCQLTGRTDFLYVADCKLATTENMTYIDGKHGRFISVLPATRREDQEFRQRLLANPQALTWDVLYEIKSEEDEVLKRISHCKDSLLSAEGYRILWFHNTQKQSHDIVQRAKKIDRALLKLADFREKLHSPKTRYRQKANVAEQVEEILKHYGVERWVVVEIQEREVTSLKKQGRGRPTKDSRYSKSVSNRYNISCTLESVRLAEDNATAGIFSLITNVPDLTPEQIVRAYGRQPIIEKRFSQLKTDFQVAPVYLKEVSRIQAFLCVYFFALVVQTLVERELRQAMKGQKYESLPMYPEQRDCTAPTTGRVIDLFEGIQRHQLAERGNAENEVFVTELSPLQRTILQLLEMDSGEYDA
jgi:transposase